MTNLNVIANQIKVLCDTTNDAKYKNDIFFKDEVSLRGGYDLAKFVVECDVKAIRTKDDKGGKKGTKDGARFKKLLAVKDADFLTDRLNRTQLNGLRRFLFKDVKCIEPQTFSIDNMIDMIKDEKFSKLQMKDFQTVVNNTKKFLAKDDDVNSSDTEGSSDTETSNDLDNKDFSKVYDAIELTLNKSNVTVDDVKSIMELSLTIIDKKIKANKVKLQASNG